jgi:hypothetical protein
MEKICWSGNAIAIARTSAAAAANIVVVEGPEYVGIIDVKLVGPSRCRRHGHAFPSSAASASASSSSSSSSSSFFLLPLQTRACFGGKPVSNGAMHFGLLRPNGKAKQESKF